MNIFYLDQDPRKAAIYHCDKHVVKMILETAQLLSTAHRVVDGNERADRWGMYKVTHQNHPSAVWVRSSSEAYEWSHDLLVYLLEEFNFRRGKSHKTRELMSSLIHLPEGITKGVQFVPPPQCMPDEYKRSCAVEGYRNYYRVAKAELLSYNWGRNAPEWLNV